MFVKCEDGENFFFGPTIEKRILEHKINMNISTENMIKYEHRNIESF